MLACWGILGSLIYEAGAQQPIAKEEAATKGPILVRLSGTESFGPRQGRDEQRLYLPCAAAVWRGADTQGEDGSSK
jgi:hypothetical protein